jgi:hypothetical protein
MSVVVGAMSKDREENKGVISKTVKSKTFEVVQEKNYSICFVALCFGSCGALRREEGQPKRRHQQLTKVKRRSG